MADKGNKSHPRRWDRIQVLEQGAVGGSQDWRIDTECHAEAWCRRNGQVEQRAEVGEEWPSPVKCVYTLRLRSVHRICRGFRD